MEICKTNILFWKLKKYQKNLKKENGSEYKNYISDIVVFAMPGLRK